MEVLVHIDRIKLRHFAFESYLSPQSLPVKTHRCSGIFREFYALLAFRVGEEAKVVFPYAFRQYHAHTLGTPFVVEVASAAALGSLGSLS
jgi:hypothetical protein